MADRAACTCCFLFFGTFGEYRPSSLAVEGLNPEKNGIKEILVPKKSELFA